MAAINAEGIPCYVGSCSEIYRERAFDGRRPATRLPVAQELGETTLMLLLHPTCGDAEMADTVRAFDKVMAVAAG
jgi:dTDP-4-amino-4,6-dideoxygalactose transaminase